MSEDEIELGDIEFSAVAWTSFAVGLLAGRMDCSWLKRVIVGSISLFLAMFVLGGLAAHAEGDRDV